MEDNKNREKKKWIILLIAMLIIAIGFFAISVKYNIESQPENNNELTETM